MIQRIRQYLADRARERRIADLTRAMVEAQAEGLRCYARKLDAQRMELINGRSASQVLRMEKRMGLRQ